MRLYKQLSLLSLSGSELQTSDVRSWSPLLVHPHLSGQPWPCRRPSMDPSNYWWERDFRNITGLEFCQVNFCRACCGVRVTHRRICLFQNVPLEQQMVESIKQEPMECAIEQPPLKKIKQEVLSTQHTHMQKISRQMWNWYKKFYFFMYRKQRWKAECAFSFSVFTLSINLRNNWKSRESRKIINDNYVHNVTMMCFGS